MADYVGAKRRSRRKVNKKSTDKPFLSRINDIKSDLMLTPFYQNTLDSLYNAIKEISANGKLLPLDCKDNMLPTVDMICYGLGNFTDSYIARYQLALLMALRANIQVEGEQCEVFDPAFTDKEKEFLQQQNFQVPEKNKEGKQSCRTDRVTVFYMPHCGKALYNNVIWQNWRREDLQRLVIIGNSFTNMIDSTPSRILCKTASYIMKISPYVQHRGLAYPPDLESIFNDTSIHTFNTQEVPEEFWEDAEEPVYDIEDAEIIFAEDGS